MIQLSRLLKTAVTATFVIICGSAVYAVDELTTPVVQEQVPSVDEVQRSIEVRDQVIRNLIRRIEELERKVDELKGNGPGEEAGPEPSPEAGTAAPADVAPPEPAQQEPDRRYEQENLIRAAFERALIERGGLLLPSYRWELEPSFSYIHSSSDRIVIDGFTILPVLVVGDIFSERIRRDSYTFSITLRVGLPWDSQVDLRVPYRFERQRVFTADSQEINDDTDGLGDIELTLSHQFVKARGVVPDILASLRWKTTSGSDSFDSGSDISLGSGFNSLGATVTAVKAVDPMVFFGSLSYVYNAKGNKPIGAIDPGDSVGISLGAAISMNLYTSINFSYDQQFTEGTKLGGVDVPGSYINTGTFSTGLSYSIGDDKSIAVGIGIGLTADAPDVQVNVSLPISF